MVTQVFSLWYSPFYFVIIVTSMRLICISYGKSISMESVQLPYGGSILAKDDVRSRSRLVVNIIKWSRWTHHNFPSTSLIWILCTLLWWVWASVLTIGWPLWSLHPYYTYFTQRYSTLANSYSWRHLLPMPYWPPIWELHTLMWYTLGYGYSGLFSLIFTILFCYNSNK